MLLRKVVSVVALISADCRSVRMSELRVLLTAPPEATGLVIRHQTFQWPRGPSSLKGCSLEDQTSAPMQARSSTVDHSSTRAEFSAEPLPPLLLSKEPNSEKEESIGSKQLFSTRRHATQSWYRLAAQTQHVDRKGRSPVRTEASRQNKGC